MGDDVWDSALAMAVRGWWRARRGTLDSIPRPLGEPRAIVAGPDTDRVLLIGNGPVAGFGVASHDLALPGQLARQIGSATGRGVDLDLLTHLDLTIATAARYFSKHRKAGYRLVISMFGSVDAVYLMPVEEWRTHLARLLARIQSEIAGTSILVVGVPPVESLKLVPQVAAAKIAARSAAIDVASKEVVRRFPRAHFLEYAPPAEPDAERHRSPATYARWASLIAPRAVELLGEARRYHGPHASERGGLPSPA